VTDSPVDLLIKRIAALAATQHGVFTTDQLPHDDQRRLRHLADRGLVRRLAKKVYVVAGAPETWMQLVTASVWALGPTAVVSHSAAARLHGLDGFTGREIEITVAREGRGKGLPSIDTRTRIPVHTTIFRADTDTVRVNGLPTTSIERTILDLARARRPNVQVEAAIDSAIRLRMTTLDRLTERLAMVEGRARWRIAHIEPLLLTSGGHTFLERRFLRLMSRAGLPLPTPQVVHRVDGRHVARVDFLYERQGIVIEVSGGRGHSSPAERAKDARRRNELQALGRLVLEFTYEQVMRTAEHVVDTVRSALHSRSVSRI